jgi:hypothetical protein
MMKRFAFAAALSTVLALPALAGGHANWTAVDGFSQVAFGSVKNDDNGEVHHFNGVTGSVTESGELTVSVDVTSVETYIDIRNERMVEHVFDKGAATATLTGQIDMEALNGMAVGETKIMEIEGTLAFAGAENKVYPNMLIARLAEDRVLVTTADFLMISTADLGITAGIDTLMELAGLDGITRVTPVSIRMIFEK